jgi:two-component system sensor histidine kinase/response regulator
MDPVPLVAGAAACAAAVAGALVAHRHGRRQDRILAALDRSARRLAGGGVDQALAATLAELGPLLGCRRLEWHRSAGGALPATSLVAAWAAAGHPARDQDPLHRLRPWHPERSRWLALLADGSPVHLVPGAVPPSERQAVDGLGETLLVPVRIPGGLDGYLLAAGRGLAEGGRTAAVLGLVADQAAALLAVQAAATALAAAEHRAAAGERTKREFLANMSHELRTPLNGILGLTGLLADEELTPRQRETAQVIRTSAENLHQLVNDIIDIAASGGDRKRVPVRCDPLRVVEDVAVLQAESAHAKGLELAVEPGPGLPARVLLDTARLRQALVNLVGNAIKFTTAGHVLVRVGWQSAAEGGTLVVEVADSGPGMDAATLAAITADFTQGDGAANRRHGGAGIGMTIVRRQIAALGGTLHCESAPGRGTSFRLAVPVEGVSTAGSERQASLTGRLRGLAVLIVEPEAAVRAALVAMCSHLGMHAEGVAGCAEALDRLGRPGAPPAIGLVGTATPGAYDLPAAAGPGTAWILLAPPSRRPTRSEAQARGFAAALARPPRLLRLADAMRRAVDPPSDESTGDRTVRVLRRTALRVLVLADDPVTQRQQRVALEAEGVRADAVSTAGEAVDAVVRLPYDAILIDLVADDAAHGCAAELRRVEQVHGDSAVPVIALCAARTPGADSRAGRAGIDALVVRPCEARDLVRRIVQAIQRRRLIG